MNRLILLFFFLSISVVSVVAQVRPDQAPLVESPDTSNFEVYGQKGGSLRRTTLDRLGDYLFDNLTISYDQALNRVYLNGFGVDIDSIDLADAAVTASLADTVLTINGTDINLSSFDNSFTWSPSTYTLILNRAGTNDTISLAGLAPALSYDNNALSLILGSDSTDVSQLRQELSYDGGTGILTLSNGGGSVTLGVDGLTSIVAASYFGGSGTSGDPLTIDDGGLTFTKIQNINNGSILGRYSAGAGVIEQLTLGENISVTSAGVINVSLDGVEAIDIVFDSDRPILRTPSEGTVIGDTTVVGWLEWWYFTPPTLTLNAPSVSLIEVGDSSGVQLTGSISNPSSTTITNNDFKVTSPIDSILVNGFGGSFLYTVPYSPKQSDSGTFNRHTYTFQMSADYSGTESGSVTSAARTINAVYPILYGVDSTDFTVAGNPYTELTKSVTNEGNKSLTLNGDGYIYFLIPKTWSDWNLSSIIDHNGFNVTASFTATDINISSSGLTNNYTNVAYRMYKLNNITSTSNFTYQINR